MRGERGLVAGVVAAVLVYPVAECSLVHAELSCDLGDRAGSVDHKSHGLIPELRTELAVLPCHSLHHLPGQILLDRGPRTTGHLKLSRETLRRILELYDHPPDDGRVVCVDEFGPLNLQPRKGKAWRPRSRPRRQRATYTRTDGVMHMLAALDLATGKLFYRIRLRKRSVEFLDLLKALRGRWPGEKLYVVCDNFSPHRHPRVRTWCQANEVELVFLPTYGSW